MKKTIFISSTYTDLIQHRKAIWELLEQYDVTVKGMEAFGARKETPLETCLNEVSQSDIYVGILAQRLGSIEKKTGKSFTQLEYERAIKENKEILIYLIDEKNALISAEHIDFDEKRQSLINFKTILKEKHTIDTFRDKNELVQKLETRFNEVIKKEVSTSISSESFDHSKDILKKFHLLPKTFTDSEIRLIVEFDGDAFPASKDLCRTFGYTYGRTIGIPVKISKPIVDSIEIKDLFIEEELSDVYFNSSSNDQHEIIAKLLFSNERVESSRANFFDYSYTVYKENPNYNPNLPASDGIFSTNSYMTGVSHNPQYITETKNVKGEGKAILVLKEVIKTTQKKKQRTKAKKS